MTLLPLVGVLVMIAGFLARINPVLVVVSAGAASGLAAGFDLTQLLTAFGDGFLRNRLLLLWVFTLPVIGLLERQGLRERARAWIVGLKAATPGRLLLAYQALRQTTAALGLVSLGGHPQTVRPLVAPMTEALAERLAPSMSDRTRQRVRALAAATDNIALFFGEDLFLAFGAVLLMQGFLKDNGIALDALHIALWGLPTAGAALTIHAWRLWLLDRRLRRPPEDRP